MIDALVLAGSPNNGALHTCSPVSYEALIPINGKLMLDYVLEALRPCSRIGRIVIVGPKDELTAHFNDSDNNTVLVEHGRELTENVLLGLKHLPGAEQVLLLTSDIPLITTQAIEDFLDLCAGEDADLYYPIVAREEVEKRFQSAQRTYVQLKEGVYTGGNICLFKPAAMEECIPRGRKLVDARKNPLQLCRLVGFVFMIKFLMKSITLAEAQFMVSRLLGLQGRVVISRYPEVGVDVDKPSDLALVCNQLAGECC